MLRLSNQLLLSPKNDHFEGNMHLALKQGTKLDKAADLKSITSRLASDQITDFNIRSKRPDRTTGGTAC